MKIVFMVGSYYPYFSAIGKCIFNLVKELENEHEIIVIANMDTEQFLREEYYEKHSIIRVRSKSMKKRDKLNNKLSNSRDLLKKWFRVRLLVTRISSAAKIVCSKNSIHSDLVKEYLQALQEIDNVDLVIPTCYPFESIYAAQQYKKHYNKNVKIIPYLFDKFSDSPTLHRNKHNKRIKFKRHLKLEEIMITESERVYIVDSWIKHMSKYFDQYKSKVRIVEHPLIIQYKSHSLAKNIERDFIKIVYTGVLDKQVRPPDLTLQTLSEVIKRMNNVIINFYTLGNYGDVLNRYCKMHPSNIIDYGYVESSKAIDVIEDSDVLLSVGNTDVSLIPSKIFEYMSCGKPILHFYTSDDDRVIQMLNSYDLALCIKQTFVPDEDTVNRIISFINRVKGLSKSFEEVANIFEEATPKYIANKLISQIN